ncbi:MAG: hypothetical protein B6I22_09615 [Desulfobacteraceae bacterium 4572_123]|nr:MAG: hypothetical protein B6I22_09615 [Desulfobacteraceae bacterium 4572_123]
MKLFLKLKIWIILFCIFMIASNAVSAQKAQLTHIIITNTRDDLLLYLNVEGAFREKMKKAIFSGVPASFSFIINLYQTKKLWKDKKIAANKISSTIKYDNLKKEFLIRRSWKNSDPVIVKSFQEAQKLMTEISSLKVIQLAELEKGRQYQIRAKAELSKLTLPFYLHYILFFVSLWDFETDWYTIDFIY